MRDIDFTDALYLGKIGGYPSQTARPLELYITFYSNRHLKRGHTSQSSRARSHEKRWHHSSKHLMHSEHHHERPLQVLKSPHLFVVWRLLCQGQWIPSLQSRENAKLETEVSYIRHAKFSYSFFLYSDTYVWVVCRWVLGSNNGVTIHCGAFLDDTFHEKSNQKSSTFSCKQLVMKHSHKWLKFDWKFTWSVIVIATL